MSTQSWTLHRDESLFPNPEKYALKPKTLVMEAQLTFSSQVRCFSMVTGSDALSDAAKAAFSPFGYNGGPRVCIGYHLALMELRLATAEFFRVCRGARLASSTTPESMRPMGFFLIMPTKHWCETIL